ncbi:hypothetical protein [Streptomyces puniciscabiei]|uniref:hypothetical protein n=1 Tax=Streptomyces puniciscabiei TaxID=164348 RepID=UPI0033323279
MSVLMSALLAVVLAVQFRLSAHRPGVYWSAVALISVVGTLIGDNLTDTVGVPLGTSTTVFAIVVAVVFVVWYRRERTLSLRHIDTTSRESFYRLAVMFTFALGSAAGDLPSASASATGCPPSCWRRPSRRWPSRTSGWTWATSAASARVTRVINGPQSGCVQVPAGTVVRYDP